MRLPIPLFNYQAYDAVLATELLGLGWRSLRPLLSLLAGTIVVALCLGEVEPRILFGWLLFSLLCTAVGLIYQRRYSAVGSVALDLPALRRGERDGVLYGGVMVGVLWGSISQLMLPDQSAHNLMITMIYLGVCASVASLASFGLGHMLTASLISQLLFLPGLRLAFPDNWTQLAVVFLFYHFVIVQSAQSRHRATAHNLILRRQQEQLLAQQRAATERAEQASQDKSAFLAAASHDLRQPVHALMLISHALRQRVSGGESRELVERILEAGQVLSDQFNNLMDLSRLESGAYRLNFSLVSLPALLQRIHFAHRQIADSKGVRLRLRIDGRLQRRALNTDASLLARVLDNLLDNAIKFTEAGSGVLITAKLQGGCVQFGVHDQGTGIPAHQRDNIFKAYVQLNNPTRDRAHGIGLGLSIVQEAATLLRGQLKVRSAPGLGSHFLLSLPADLALVAPASLPMPNLATTTQSSELERLRGRRLLIVEDDPMAATALCTWVQDWGLQVEHYIDPRAVAMVPAPDLVLCDIRLPGGRDGISWLAEWLGLWPDARGLLLSGELSSETHERAEQEGLLLLSKPVNPELLLQTLIGLVHR